MNFRHLLGCDTIERTQNLIFDTQEQTWYLILKSVHFGHVHS